MEFWPENRLRAIDRMLNPRSIAIVGASSGGSYGGRLLKATLRSKDRVPVYPVNPKYDELGGVPCFKSLADVPGSPDLVGVVVPYVHVLDVLDQCRQKGAGSAVIISAGFSERGTESGHALQAQVAAFAREKGFHFTGPNCLGLANVRDDIWATASSRTLGGLTGHIALVCQSGATAFGPFLLRAVDSGIGLSHIISTGNEIDLDFTDFARYLLDDPETRVIAGFVEGFKNLDKFIEVAKLAAEREKPIVLIKIGRSESGARAARSHTAALTGADSLIEAVFRQYGVIRVNDYDELLETSQLLANSRKPKKRGIAVVSHSGGISSLTADMLGHHGLDLPQLSDKARDGINSILKDFGWAANPADVTGFARKPEFVQIMDHLIEEPEVGTLVVASAGAGEQVQQVVALRDKTDKNVAFFWTSTRHDNETLPALKASGIPIFYSPEKLAQGLRAMRDYYEWLERRRAPAAVQPMSALQREALARARALGRPQLSEAESKALVSAWDIPMPREIPAQSAGGAAEAADTIGYPVVLKVDSADILHKTEAGAVRVGLDSAEAVKAAYEEIVRNARAYAPSAQIKGVLVCEMVRGGVETLVGVQHDPQLGPMLVFGSGGVTVEVYGDVAMRRCPVSREEAMAMIGETKGAKLLGAFRGRPPGDIDALAALLERVSAMAAQLGDELAELDLNPVLVLPQGRGVRALDALVVLK